MSPPSTTGIYDAAVLGGADVNAKGLGGQTALDVALEREEEEKAALLRRYGGERGDGG